MTPEQQKAQERIDALLEEVSSICKEHELATIACILTGVSAQRAMRAGAQFATGLLATLTYEETSENQKAFALGLVGYLLDNTQKGTPEDLEDFEDFEEAFNQTPVGHA